MSESPNDDPLIHFLKQHRSIPPEASPDLEDRILAALDSDQEQLQDSISTAGSLVSWKWVSSLIAAGFTIVWIAHRTLLSSPVSPTEQSQLEGFIESSWDGAMQETQETSWLAIPYSPQD
ncbi:MAG: hypothetical protein SWJ54_17130 [Cyanobacteriota bacterium]|nr:hypothetical protein [Cyanobacteriota bacterium]